MNILNIPIAEPSVPSLMYFNNDRSGVCVRQESSCNQGDWKDKPPITEAIDS